MRLPLVSIVLALLLSSSDAAIPTLQYIGGHPQQHLSNVAPPDNNNGIHLAVSPVCGPLSGKVFDVNAGINLKQFKTIVSFGDSYTDGGRQDGGPLPPPVIVPPDAGAGGRSTDGKVWIEDIADDIGATLMDYAVYLSLWPSAIRKVDLLGQMKTFLGQWNSLDPNTTLYTAFFGINDFGDSKTDGEANLQAAAQVILSQIRILASPPMNARSFLVTDMYGLGTHTPAGDAFVQTIFSGLDALHRGVNSTGKGQAEGLGPRLNVAFAEFSRIWDGGPDRLTEHKDVSRLCRAQPRLAPECPCVSSPRFTCTFIFKTVPMRCVRIKTFTATATNRCGTGNPMVFAFEGEYGPVGWPRQFHRD